MYTIDDQLLKKSLINAKLNGLASHYICDCPFCGKHQHLYVQRKTTKTTKTGRNASYYWQCKKCEQSGGIYKLLKKLNKLHIIRNEREVNALNTFNKRNLLSDLVQDEVNHNPTKALGFRQIYDHEYLRYRRFEKWQYALYNVGIAPLDRALKGYIVFNIYNNDRYQGYIARLAMTPQQQRDYELKIEDKALRYKNSKMTDFSSLLFGLDEIQSTTQVVIVVEGLFDKATVDRLLNVSESDEIKCVACFGKKISNVQIQLLLDRGVDSVILLYDSDAVQATKKYSYELSSYFDSVYVGWVRKGDPGDLHTRSELNSILDNLYDPMSFYTSKVDIKSL